MKKNLFVLAMASVFALTGCHGLAKTEYAQFKEKADKAVESAQKVDYVTYKGKYGDEKISFSTNQGIASYSLSEAAVEAALSLVGRVDSFTVAENSDYTYYTGFGFKVVTPDAKYEYTGKGFLAGVKGKIKGTEYNFSVSYKFVK